MNTFNHKLRLLTLLFLSIVLVFLYPVSALSMNHGQMNMETLMPHGSITGLSFISDLPINAAKQCVNFHLSLLKLISESPLQVPIGLVLFVVIILALGFLYKGLIKQLLEYFQTLLCIKHQRLKSVSLTAFIKELGHWLSIIEKKTPSYAFAIA